MKSKNKKMDRYLPATSITSTIFMALLIGGLTLLFKIQTAPSGEIGVHARGYEGLETSTKGTEKVPPTEARGRTEAEEAAKTKTEQSTYSEDQNSSTSSTGSQTSGSESSRSGNTEPESRSSKTTTSTGTSGDTGNGVKVDSATKGQTFVASGTTVTEWIPAESPTNRISAARLAEKSAKEKRDAQSQLERAKKIKDDTAIAKAEQEIYRASYNEAIAERASAEFQLKDPAVSESVRTEAFKKYDAAQKVIKDVAEKLGITLEKGYKEVQGTPLWASISARLKKEGLLDPTIPAPIAPTPEQEVKEITTGWWMRLFERVRNLFKRPDLIVREKTLGEQYEGSLKRLNDYEAQWKDSQEALEQDSTFARLAKEAERLRKEVTIEITLAVQEEQKKFNKVIDFYSSAAGSGQMEAAYSRIQKLEAIIKNLNHPPTLADRMDSEVDNSFIGINGYANPYMILEFTTDEALALSKKSGEASKNEITAKFNQIMKRLNDQFLEDTKKMSVGSEEFDYLLRETGDERKELQEAYNRLMTRKITVDRLLARYIEKARETIDNDITAKKELIQLIQDQIPRIQEEAYQKVKEAMLRFNQVASQLGSL